MEYVQMDNDNAADDTAVTELDKLELPGIPTVAELEAEISAYDPNERLKLLPPEQRARARELLRAGGGKPRNGYDAELKWQSAEIGRLEREIARLQEDHAAISGYDPSDGSPIPVYSEPRRKAMLERINDLKFKASSLQGTYGQRLRQDALREAALKEQRLRKRAYILKEGERRAEAMELEAAIEERAKTLLSHRKTAR